MGASLQLPEAAARSVLLLRAHETAGAESPLWTAQDSAWATRAAREAGAATLPPARALALRAEHAMQRLAPRDKSVRARAAQRMFGSIWVPLLLGLAFAAGLAADSIGGTQRINLLAPPVWGVIVWNLAVYLGLLLPRAPAAARGLRAWLARRLQAAGGAGGVMQSYAQAWAQASAPLATARAAALLHAAAAVLAAGLVAGLYVRGLVLDYRAGWESTFLDAQAVRSGLAALLAPASALTGIAVPDLAGIEALRVGPDTRASAPAADWLHLFAAMLLLFVVLPRLLLAGVAVVQAWHRGRHVELPQDAYSARLLRELQGAQARVQVLPQGAAPSPQATLGLRAWLAAACGEDLQLSLEPAVAYGAEDAVSALAPAPGTTLRVLLVDLGSTPEPDTHGRLLAALRAQPAPGAQWLLLADESAFRERFAQMPERLEQRRAAWRALAAEQGVGFIGLALQAPPLEAAEAALQTALQAARPAEAT